MYQELIVHLDTFESPPVWGTEGNDLPLPTLAVGDVLAVPGLTWRDAPDPQPVYRVTAVKHVFTEMGGPTPEANHQMVVTVAQHGAHTLDEELKEELASALNDAEKHRKHSAFWRTLLQDVVEQRAPAIQGAVLQSIRQTMKNQPAFGMAEAGNEWQEAASILQADGHELAEMLRGTLAGSVVQAVKALPREERLVLWLAAGGLHEEWETAAEPHGFEPDGRSNALDHLQEKLLRQLQTQLLNTPLD